MKFESKYFSIFSPILTPLQGFLVLPFFLLQGFLVPSFLLRFECYFDNEVWVEVFQYFQSYSYFTLSIFLLHSKYLESDFYLPVIFFVTHIQTLLQELIHLIQTFLCFETFFKATNTEGFYSVGDSTLCWTLERLESPKDLNSYSKLRSTKETTYLSQVFHSSLESSKHFEFPFEKMREKSIE